MALLEQDVTLSLLGGGGGMVVNGSLTVLTGDTPLAENSFELPLKAGSVFARLWDFFCLIGSPHAS